MSNSSIILFGKPDSFESYQLSSTGFERIFDSFIEPELKVSQNQGYVYHQFIISGVSYLQIYCFAQAFQSGREGIVIGAAFKSDSLIDLCYENFNTLKIILEKFKNLAIDGIGFKSNSLDKTVQHIYQEVLAYMGRIKYKKNNPSKSINQSLLLYLQNFENSLTDLRDEINLLTDVYLSNSKDVFASKINIKYLYSVENKVYTLNEENKIVEYINVVEQESTISSDFIETGPDEIKKLKNQVLEYKSKYDNLDNKLIHYKNITARRIRILSIASILFCLTVFSFFFKGIFFPDKKNLAANKTGAGQNPESSNTNQTKSAEQNNTNSLINILDNPSKLDTLFTLCKDIKSYKKKWTKPLYNSIYKGGIALGLDVSFIEKYNKSLEEERTVETAKKRQADKKTPRNDNEKNMNKTTKPESKIPEPKENKLKRSNAKKDSV